jgi:RNA polymerase sigma-70 factor (ECF subfamily)
MGLASAFDAREATDPSVATPSSAATPEEVFTLVYRQMRKLAPRHEVEELTQIAAEQALRGLARFEGRSQLATWTFRICYLTVRKHERWYRRWLRRFTLTTDGELPELPAKGGLDEQGLVDAERAQRLRAALDRLSTKRRTVVVLHDLEGLPVEAIAPIVGASVAATRSRLRDGRKLLALELSRDPYFGDEACGAADLPEEQP